MWWASSAPHSTSIAIRFGGEPRANLAHPVGQAC